MQEAAVMVCMCHTIAIVTIAKVIKFNLNTRKPSVLQ